MRLYRETNRSQCVLVNHLRTLAGRLRLGGDTVENHRPGPAAASGPLGRRHVDRRRRGRGRTLDAGLLADSAAESRPLDSLVANGNVSAIGQQLFGIAGGAVEELKSQKPKDQ